MTPHHHRVQVDWRHLILPGFALAVVVVVGALAIWSFIQRQSLVIQPDAPPRITIVTGNPSSPLAASWIRLLTEAQMSATLVSLETFDPIEGVVIFCDIGRIPARLGLLLEEFARRGGAIGFAGTPAKEPVGSLRLLAEKGPSDSSMRLGENASPVLARLGPGERIAVRRSEVALLRESPRMGVDARWAENSRAAVMHQEISGSRYLWFGFNPSSLISRDVVGVMLRSAFRWAAGLPVSDGAVGAAQNAKALTVEARQNARDRGFFFSVDRSKNPRMFTVRMINRGNETLPNPTVKIWMPPRVTKVTLGGDIIMRRGATLTGVPEEGACLISLPNLRRGEDRVMKLEIVELRPFSAKATAPYARP